MTLDQAAYVEIFKLIAHLVISLAVTLLAVRSAFGRFKKEKLWERQLDAYADVFTALGAMRMILGRWGDEMEGLRSYSDEVKKAFNVEYGEATRQFERTVAVGQLILPEKSAKTLGELARQLEADAGLDPFDTINTKYGIIDDAFAILRAQGRISLR